MADIYRAAKPVNLILRTFPVETILPNLEGENLGNEGGRIPRKMDSENCREIQKKSFAAKSATVQKMSRFTR